MKILVWGTGRLAGKVIGKHVDLKNIEAFIDNETSKKEYMGKRVICPIQILNLQYDAILVANLFREEISCQCIEPWNTKKKSNFSIQ